MDNPRTARTIRYRFRFAENNEKVFEIQLDPQTMDIIVEPQKSYPEWTKLSHLQCSNCPLDSQEHEYCPIAQKLSGAIEFFCQPIPFQDVDLLVETPERSYSKKTDLKSAAVSLIGIYMAAGGCPIMDKLRPMVRHHLPLATTQETAYRSLANYLVAQLLLARRGKDADWGLKDLGGIYDAIKTVNTHFRERLLKISREDCALSAILTLDAHAYYINLSLIGNTFYAIENLFDEDLENRSIVPRATDSGSAPSEDVLTFRYQFNFHNNSLREFQLKIDPESMVRLSPAKTIRPSWTKLDCHQCPNCPLTLDQHPSCPAAASIADMIESLQETLTIRDVNIVVEAAERNYVKTTSLADGLSSLIGLAVATSGCPVFGRIKPLIAQHLPFESSPEMTYRSLGMYLLYQKFSPKNKEHPDWNLAGFGSFFEGIDTACRAFLTRLKEIPSAEEGLQELLNFRCLHQYEQFDIFDEYIQELQTLFGKSH